MGLQYGPVEERDCGTLFSPCHNLQSFSSITVTSSTTLWLLAYLYGVSTSSHNRTIKLRSGGMGYLAAFPSAAHLTSSKWPCIMHRRYSSIYYQKVLHTGCHCDFDLCTSLVANYCESSIFHWRARWKCRENFSSTLVPRSAPYLSTGKRTLRRQG